VEHNLFALLGVLIGTVAGIACGPWFWRFGYYCKGYDGGAKVSRPWA
jgi:hypothetical protein